MISAIDCLLILARLSGLFDALERNRERSPKLSLDRYFTGDQK